MHAQGCPKNNNLYADCECAAIDQRNHTAALLNHAEALRKHDEAATELEALQRENVELKTTLQFATNRISEENNLLQQNDTLRAQNRELEKDKARLDWLNNLPDSYEFKPNLHAQDIRQAIDAVINKCPYHHDEFQVDSKGRDYCEECQREAATRMQQIDDATLGEP